MIPLLMNEELQPAKGSQIFNSIAQAFKEIMQLASTWINKRIGRSREQLPSSYCLKEIFPSVHSESLLTHELWERLVFE